VLDLDLGCMRAEGGEHKRRFLFLSFEVHAKAKGDQRSEILKVFDMT
jgi:hypothetical protein